MAIFKNFCDGAYTLDDRDLAFQECINFYPELSNDIMTLQPTGGYQDLVDFNNGGYIRNLYRTTKSIGTTNKNSVGSLIAVCGSEVIWVKDDNSFEVLGLISNLLKSVDIVDDGIGIVIADGEQMYRIDMTTLDFSVIDFKEIKPTKLAVLDYRTIVIGEDTNGLSYSNRFYYSDLADNSSWSALSYFEMAGTKEPILNISSDSTRLYLFGRNIYQIWQTNSRSITKPFARSSLGLDSVGIFATDSLCQLAGTMFFIGSIAQGDPMIYSCNGSEVQKISTTALDRELSNVDINDCTSYSYSEQGHNFIAFNFDILDKTIVYDTTTKKWHNRAYRDERSVEHRWQPQYFVSRNGEFITGSGDESKLYLYSKDIYTQSDSGDILRRRTSPNLKNENKMITTNRIMLDVEVGKGVVGTFEAPKLMMRYAYDGGYSGWSSRQDVTIGSRGQYLANPQFIALGTGRALVLEISISDNAKTAIHNVYLLNKVSNMRGL